MSSFDSATRLEELNTDLKTLFELLVNHTHASTNPFYRISFLDLKDVPSGIGTPLTPEDYYLRNIVPLRTVIVDGIHTPLDTTVDGTTTVYSLPWIPFSTTLAVYLQGRYLTRDVDYNIVENLIHFSEPPPAGSILLADLTPISASTNPLIPRLVTNITPLLQGSTIVYRVPKPIREDSLRVYRQGLRLAQGEEKDYNILSLQRFELTQVLGTASLLVDYQVATGAQDLYMIIGEDLTSQVVGNPSTFTLNEMPVEGSIQLYIGGTRILPSAYSVIGNTITCTSTKLLDSPNVVIDYQTNTGTLVGDIRTHSVELLSETSLLELEEWSSDEIVSSTHQVYVQGVRKKSGVDYVVSGTRNNQIEFNTPISGNIVIDYHV